MLDINKVRNDFPMLKNNRDIIYFDNASTSFKPQCVIDEINNYYTKYNTNIHRGDYDLSFRVSSEYEETRKVVKEFINANSENEIIFTSGATQSLNTIAYSYGFENLKKGDVILTTEVEHASSILPWFEVAKKTGAEIKYIPLNKDGTFNINNYVKCFIDYKNIKIVEIAYVSNVLGIIYPIKEITKIAHEHGSLVSVDGAQAVPHIKVDVKDLDIDFLSFSSHKMIGPNGVGVLYGKYEILKKLKPLLYGGGSNARFNKSCDLILKKVPYNFESGTPNIEGVLGLKKAIEYLNNISMEEVHKYEISLKDYMLEKLSKLDNVIIYNQKADTGIIAFNIKDIFSQDAASYLNSKGICLRSGNHCAKILDNIIGASDTMRASLYFYNTKDEIDRFVEVVKETTLDKCIGVVI